MAIANGAIYPIVVAGRCVPSLTRNWSRRSFAEHSTTGSVLPRKSGSFLADQYQHAIAHHHQRDVINSSAGRAGDYMMQRCEEVGCQNHGNAGVALANHTDLYRYTWAANKRKFCLYD